MLQAAAGAAADASAAVLLGPFSFAQALPAASTCIRSWRRPAGHAGGRQLFESRRQSLPGQRAAGGGGCLPACREASASDCRLGGVPTWRTAHCASQVTQLRACHPKPASGAEFHRRNTVCIQLQIRGVHAWVRRVQCWCAPQAAVHRLVWRAAALTWQHLTRQRPPAPTSCTVQLVEIQDTIKTGRPPGPVRSMCRAITTSGAQRKHMPHSVLHTHVRPVRPSACLVSAPAPKALPRLAPPCSGNNDLPLLGGGVQWLRRFRQLGARCACAPGLLPTAGGEGGSGCSPRVGAGHARSPVQPCSRHTALPPCLLPPGSIMTAFTSPAWLVNLANAMVVAHLGPAYQVGSEMGGSHERWRPVPAGQQR